MRQLERKWEDGGVEVVFNCIDMILEWRSKNNIL